MNRSRSSASRSATTSSVPSRTSSRRTEIPHAEEDPYAWAFRSIEGGRDYTEEPGEESFSSSLHRRSTAPVSSTTAESSVTTTNTYTYTSPEVVLPNPTGNAPMY